MAGANHLLPFGMLRERTYREVSGTFASHLEFVVDGSWASIGMLIFVAPSVDGSCKIMGADLLNRSFASCFLVLAVSLHGSRLLPFVFFPLSDGSLGG